MMRAIGFLSGVGLTAAAFLLVLNGQQPGPAESSAETHGAATAEQISGVVAAIAEEVDSLPAEVHLGATTVAEPVADHTETTAAIDTAPADPEAQPQAWEQAVLSDAPTTSENSARETGFEAAALGADAEPVATQTPEPASTAESEIDTATQAHMQALQTDTAHAMDLPAQTQSADTRPGTYQFWSPFRSAWSARGFAQRLHSATQVPVEVIHAGPGNYQVAFSYRDESERLANIERIESVTGLQLE
jgi:hypothetical protein